VHQQLLMDGLQPDGTSSQQQQQLGLQRRASSQSLPHAALNGLTLSGTRTGSSELLGGLLDSSGGPSAFERSPAQQQQQHPALTPSSRLAPLPGWMQPPADKDAQRLRPALQQLQGGGAAALPTAAAAGPGGGRSSTAAGAPAAAAAGEEGPAPKRRRVGFGMGLARLGKKAAGAAAAAGGGAPPASEDGSTAAADVDGGDVDAAGGEQQEQEQAAGEPEQQQQEEPSGPSRADISKALGDIEDEVVELEAQLKALADPADTLTNKLAAIDQELVQIQVCAV
jgi:hypothetical protein